MSAFHSLESPSKFSLTQGLNAFISFDLLHFLHWLFVLCPLLGLYPWPAALYKLSGNFPHAAFNCYQLLNGNEFPEFFSSAYSPALQNEPFLY